MPGAGGRQVEHVGEPPAAEVEAAWQDLAAYLSTFGDSDERIRQLTTLLGTRAVRRWQVRRDRPLAEIAFEEVEADLTAWAFFVIGRERIGDHSAVLVARVAYPACEAAERWPGVLLSYDLPPEFVAAMREAAPLPTPPERPGRMVAQPLERWSPADVGPRLWHRLVGAISVGSRASAMRRP